MSHSSPLKAFVFDAYGTVFDVHSVAELAEQFFPGDGKALSQVWRSKQIEYMFLRTLMGRYIPHNENTESALVYACKALGLKCDEARRAKLMDAYLRLTPFPEATAALDALSGHKRAILSVGTKPMLTQMVAHAGLERRFDKLISVDPARVYKPHPATYQLVLDELGVTRSEVGFVTSNYFDVAGAKAFGFTVFWINRNKALPDELGLLPDHVLNDLGGLKLFA